MWSWSRFRCRCQCRSQQNSHGKSTKGSSEEACDDTFFIDLRVQYLEHSGAIAWLRVLDLSGCLMVFAFTKFCQVLPHVWQAPSAKYYKAMAMAQVDGFLTGDNWHWASMMPTRLGSCLAAMYDHAQCTLQDIVVPC